MTTYQGRTGRLISGGKLKKSSGKKKRMLGRAPAETQIGDEVRRKVRVRGGNHIHRLFQTNTVNVVNKKTGKVENVEIKDVKSNPASRDFSRRRIITKGAILETSMGNAKVTNKPGKEGFVNAILLEDE